MTDVPRDCIHCRRPHRDYRHRLCGRCRSRPELRSRYRHMPRREPTEAELDAMIEQQRKNLPSWWKCERPHSEGDK